jgi:hypothetical protein
MAVRVPRGTKKTLWPDFENIQPELRSSRSQADVRRCSADIPVCEFTGLSSPAFRNWRLESRRNSPAGKPCHYPHLFDQRIRCTSRLPPQSMTRWHWRYGSPAAEGKRRSQSDGKLKKMSPMTRAGKPARPATLDSTSDFGFNAQHSTLTEGTNSKPLGSDVEC